MLLAGCEAQPWRFLNGVDVPEGPPPRLVAEIFAEGDCGFECRPASERIYCADLVDGSAGPSPDGLVRGERYCFMGTALGADGQAFAYGCGIYTVGGEPIEITLSLLEEGRVIARECAPPVVRIDAGPRDAGGRDAGAPRDAGGVDAGPVDAGRALDAGRVGDAGARPDAGLPFGTPVSVSLEVIGGGGLYVTHASSGTPLGSQPLRPPTVRTVEGSVGLEVRLEAVADGGSTFSRFEGGGCGANPVCIVAFSRTELVRAYFE